MSELLQVAAALRKFSDAELHQLVQQRTINTAAMRDFFDFAEALTAAKSVASAVSALPSSLAQSLIATNQGLPTDEKSATRLRQLVLADESGLFESVKLALTEVTKNAPDEPSDTTNSSEFSLLLDATTVDRDAGLHAFETLQALTELVFDLEQRYVREVGKGNVGLPDIKRLAAHLSKTNDYAKEIFELATQAGLMTLVAGRWQFGEKAPEWLTSTPSEQIALLWQVWSNQMGNEALIELADGLDKVASPAGIRELMSKVYPFADRTLGSRNSKLEALTERIGLAASGAATSWLRHVLRADISSATQAIAANLPAQQAKIICQADLTLIATGPLPIEVEIQLRKFAETEVIGMASTYRLTTLSVTHGLETGLSEANIRTLLEKLSGKALPQPIDYLLKEASSRFGRLVVHEGELNDRSIVSSTDAILLTEVLNDTNLKAFSIVRLEDGVLSSRFEPEVLYFGLREAGYAAIRKNSKGELISPLKTIAAAKREVDEGSIQADLTRMREHEQKMGGELDGDEVNRPIQLAIKNKAKLEVVVNNAGAEIVFVLEPIGIANGRLRAKDRKADIERTLPLTSIIRVSII